MKDKFTMKNGVPVKKNNQGRKRKYNFHKMKKGDSETIGNYSVEKMRTVASSAIGFCKRYRNNWHFQVTKENNKLVLQRIK